MTDHFSELWADMLDDLPEDEGDHHVSEEAIAEAAKCEAAYIEDGDMQPADEALRTFAAGLAGIKAGS